MDVWPRLSRFWFSKGISNWCYVTSQNNRCSILRFLFLFSSKFYISSIHRQSFFRSSLFSPASFLIPFFFFFFFLTPLFFFSYSLFFVPLSFLRFFLSYYSFFILILVINLLFLFYHLLLLLLSNFHSL